MFPSNYSKKFKKIFYVWLFLATIVFPLSSFAQTGQTTQPQVTYSYNLMEKQTFPSNEGVQCSVTLRDYLNKDQITRVVDLSKISLFCPRNEKNEYIFYKLGSAVSQKYSDKTSCDNAALQAREPVYQPIIDLFNKATGKTLTFKDDFKFLYSCNTNIPAEANIGNADSNANYYPLAQLPQLGEECAPDSTGKNICIKVAPECHQDPKNPTEQICTPGLGFAGYLNIMINIFIGICAVLAMIMIVMGGIQYMTSELPSTKGAGKDTISKAVLGLLLALGAYAILNTINPDLLKIGLGNLPTATITTPGGDEKATSFTPLSTDVLKDHNIYCPGTGGKSELPKIAKSFEGKVTYSQEKRSTATSDTIYLDCSSYAKQVYKCAGLDFNGYNTASMFPGTEVITSINGNIINGSYQLQPGDLLGWMNGETSKYSGGHVVMYYNTNNQIETHGPSDILNKAISERSVNYYGDSLKHIIKASGSSASSGTTEKLLSVNYSALKFTFNIEGFNPQKTYSYFIKGGTQDFHKPISNNLTGNITAAEYQYIKGKTVSVEVRNPKGTSIGKVTGIKIP